MLLNALWAGSCTQAAALPDCCQKLADALGLPLIFLQRNDGPGQSCTAYFEDAELSRDLTLGDVLSHELDLEVAPGALALVLSGKGRGGWQGQGMTLLAAAVEAGIRRANLSLPVSLQIWTCLSLTAPLVGDCPELAEARDAAIAHITGYPAERAQLSLETYLSLLEPGLILPPADPDLARRLSGCSDFNDWSERLQAAFVRSSQCDMARSS